MRILIDTNILMDYIADREPFSDDAFRLMELCTEQTIDACIAAHTIPNLFFILRKTLSINERKSLLLNLCDIFKVIGIESDKIQIALKNEDFGDFEDCLQMECAKEFSADYIITRNIDDYKSSDIAAIPPQKLFELL